MNVRSCKQCGRLFNTLFDNEDICPNCKDKLETKFQEVKDFIYNNKDSKIDTVAKECDVSVRILYKWVREGRLEFSNPENSGIFCDRCKIPISSGRYCQKCQLEMQKELNSVYDTKKPDKNKPISIKSDNRNEMRFINKSNL